MDSLEEEKESELAEAQEELRAAQEEVLVLQQAAEEAAAERENDIASLQEELCRLRAELQRLHATTAEYELEITTLRAEITMKSQRREEERREGGDDRGSALSLRSEVQSGRGPSGGSGQCILVLPQGAHMIFINGLNRGAQTELRRNLKYGDVGQLKEECRTLKDECQTLKDDNRQLSERLQLLQLQRKGSNDVYLALKEEDEVEEGDTPLTQWKDAGFGPDDELTEDQRAGSYMSMTQQPRTNCRLVDASIQKNISFEGKPMTPTSWNGGFAEVFSLRDQLKQAEEKATQVQRECEGLKADLQELQGLFDCSQRERVELESELRRYREELDRLTGRKAQGSEADWTPLLVVAMAAAVLMIVPSLSRALS
ncbi:hypothetical protein JZ751_008926 [Albula glossodonta]|uniref:Coiled-coil domain-containing protein 136-like n=1 Tax=Albula glossodonta TaxID=121402 RepID=A0A8T2P373_9TELE|nr:hypothetical protein JZ751_008926 [Albula glossodonta]